MRRNTREKQTRITVTYFCVLDKGNDCLTKRLELLMFTIVKVIFNIFYSLMGTYLRITKNTIEMLKPDTCNANVVFVIKYSGSFINFTVK